MIKLLAACLLLTASAAAQADPALRIQYAEPIALGSGTGNVSFDAYGRRFDLTLSNNDRVTSKLPQQRKAELAGVRILRGALNGQPHSWVRLTEFDGTVEGAIWDGKDFYAVTSLGRIAPYLTTPVAGAPNQTVVYRLSDTILALPKKFGDDVEESTSGNALAQYRSLVGELSATAASSATIPLQIEISLIGDSQFQSLYGSNSTELLLARHNVADGVYAEQVGLLIIPTDVRLAPGSPDPFTSTDPSTLLGQLSTFRQGNATVSALGIAHLVTGRDLNGDTVGIARLGGVCSVTDGISLSEASSLIAMDGLTMAHEIGHNLGAVHDGTGVCAATPTNYLMAPSFNWSSTFSQCSLDTMRPVIQAAKCITPANYGDVSLPANPPTLSVEAEAPLTIPFVVSSSGTQTARNATLDFNLALDVNVSATNGATCTVSGQAVHCVLGDIPAGEQRTVTLTVSTAVNAQFSIDAHVSADNNPSTHNDDEHQVVNVLINADARLTMTASASAVLDGDPVDFTVLVESLRSHAVQGAVVTFNGQLLQVTSASVPGGTCRVDSNQTTCTLDDIPGGSSRTITVHTTAANVGLAQPTASVNANVDGDSTNNFARLDVRVNAARDVGIDEVTGNLISLFGQPFEFDANLHSYGVQPSDNVMLGLLIQQPAYAAHNDAIESVTIGGTVCAPQLAGGSYYQCTLGTFAPGEVRAVVIKGHGADLGTYAFQLTVYSTGDQFRSNDMLSHGITVMHGVDVAVLPAANFTLPETQENYGSVSVVSNGSRAVSNAQFDVTAPAALRFTRLYIPPDKGTCSIVSDQHFQCQLSFPDALHGTGGAGINYFMVGSAPGSYNLTAQVTAANDEVPANDSASLPVTVTPLIDIGVKDYTVPSLLLVGSDMTVNTTVFTGSRPVPAGSALVGVNSGAEISSITSGAGTCTRIDPTRFQCDLGDLPGSASVPISAVVHGVQASSANMFFVNASAPTDNNQADNIRSANFQVAAAAEVSVTTPSSVAAVAGVQFSLPVSLQHTGTLVAGHLMVTLPDGITLNSMSGSALICTGVSSLDCTLTDWPQSQTMEVDLNLQAASAGNYSVKAKVTASNDTDTTNNECSTAITVAAAPTPPPPAPPSSGGGSGSSSSGGGGGGSLDLSMLMALALLLEIARRTRRRYAVASERVSGSHP